MKPFLRKRISFQHERELRAIVSRLPSDTAGVNFDLETIADGVQAPVDVHALVEEIRVAPTAALWFREVVAAVSKQFKLDCQVVQSSLDGKPAWSVL